MRSFPLLFLLLLSATLASSRSISLSLQRSKPHPNAVFGHEDPQVVQNAVQSYLAKFQDREDIHSTFNRAHNVKMGGNINPLGIYYVQVTVGTPPQPVNVAVDTGSYTFVVPGPQCKGCPKAPSKYDYTKSSTYSSFGCSQCSGCDQAGRCTWSNTYQTCNLSDTTQPCTISGFACSDVFGLGDLRSKGTTRLGVITYQTANFQQLYVIDGIIGFAKGTTFGQEAQIFQLAKEKQISKKFGMCFDSQSQHGGVLTLGDPDDNLRVGSYQSTPFLSSTSFANAVYVIEMKDILLGSVSIGAPQSYYTSSSAGGTIVDSGTNIILLPTELWNPLKSTLLSFCSTKKLKGMCDVKPGSTLFEGKCFKLSSKDINEYPPLTFSYKGESTMVLQSNQYLLPKVGDSTSFCLGIQNSGRNGLFIIGDTTMEGYYSVFDLENQKMLWAPVNKNNCKGI